MTIFDLACRCWQGHSGFQALPQVGCVFTASPNFSDTWPGTTGDGIGLPNCTRKNLPSPPSVANPPIYPLKYNRFRHEDFFRTARCLLPARLAIISGFGAIMSSKTRD